MNTIMNQNIIISSEKKMLDLHFIHNFISNSYWAKGRTIEEVKICIDNSLNFGVYLNGKQIGYARVVTDYIVFAYLMDLFIDENYRKKGYSKLLMEYIMTNTLLKNVKAWKLATQDAHFLYEKFGFKLIEKPEKMMEKINKF